MADAERQLKRLYWLQEFTFAAGSAIRPEYVRVLHEQIEIGENKLAELGGDFGLLPKPQPEQSDLVTR